MTTKPKTLMEPVRAWGLVHKARQVLTGVQADEPKQLSYHDAIPVIVSDARWLTRAEFEARGKNGWCWVYLEEHKLPAFYQLNSIYMLHEVTHCEVVNASCIEGGGITHVKPIHAPSAPEV